jgi:hypothetical protein
MQRTTTVARPSQKQVKELLGEYRKRLEEETKAYGQLKAELEFAFGQLALYDSPSSDGAHGASTRPEPFSAAQSTEPTHRPGHHLAQKRDRDGWVSVEDVVALYAVQRLEPTHDQVIAAAGSSDALEVDQATGPAQRRRIRATGQVVPLPRVELAPDHLAAMTEALRYHPKAEQKMGEGVAGMFVRRFGPHACFFVRRIDGTEEDFSCTKLHKGAARCRSDEVRLAFREAVEADVEAFRQQARRAGEELRCGISGRPIAIESDEWDIDHQDPPSFAQIVNEFLAEREMDKAEVAVVKSPGEVKPRLADDQLRRAFREVHEERARLRVVLKAEHRRMNQVQQRSAARQEA